MRRFSFMVASVLSFAAACDIHAYVVVRPLNPSPTPLVARPPEKVEMYTTAAPTRAYVEVGQLESSDPYEIRRKAGQIGCDALIVMRPGTDHVDTVATCVVWKP